MIATFIANLTHTGALSPIESNMSTGTNDNEKCASNGFEADLDSLMEVQAEKFKVEAPLHGIALGPDSKPQPMSEEELEKLWNDFSNIVINDDDEIESDFHLWDAGTDRFEILQWFDNRLKKGLHSYMYGEK